MESQGSLWGQQNFHMTLNAFPVIFFSIFKKEQHITAIPSVLENRYYSRLSEKSHHIFLASSHSKFLIEFLMVTKSCSPRNYNGISWIFWKVSLFWMWEWKKRTFELTEALLLMYVLRVMQPWVKLWTTRLPQSLLGCICCQMHIGYVNLGF